MATFVGKHPKDAADPTLAHDHEPMDPWTQPLVFAGEQKPSDPDPAVHAMPRRKRDREPVTTWFDNWAW